jgi:hypothetical protein
MTRHAHSLAERHPDRKDSILELANQNSAFDDVCGRFSQLWDRLNEMENEPADSERMRRELKHLELAMLNMMSNHTRL